MKAARQAVVLMTLGFTGIFLVGLGALVPIDFDFAGPLLAEPSANGSQTTGAKAPTEQSVPAFAPGTTTNFSDTKGAASSSLAPATGSIDQSASSSKPKPFVLTTEPIAPPATAPAADSVEASPDPDPVKDAAAPQPSQANTAREKTANEPRIIGAKNLFGAAKTPSPLAARAIGSYSRGCLSGAVPLPIDGPAWQEMRLSRNRNWGHPVLIALVENFAKEAQKLDGWPGLLVGDIAQPRGGPMISGHASHQVGLDADIWLTPMPDRRLTSKEREDMQATSMLDKTDRAVDPKVFTDKQVALIKRAASYPEVERIFVHPAIKKALCTAAKTDNKWLGKVRPYYGHYYHFHVRIKCPPGFGGCVPQVAPNGDDGCGKEVDQWLARVVPAKTPATPQPPKPPEEKPSIAKLPIMLSELPKECQTLLTTGPEPISIPKEALMTPVAARQLLIKAAAAKAALQKAAAVSGAKNSAPGSAAASSSAAAAASPALRPHMRKTVDADKK